MLVNEDRGRRSGRAGEGSEGENMSTASASYGGAQRSATGVGVRRYATPLNGFMVIVALHWAEHIAQAIQIWALDWKRPEARGILGLWFPWLISSEWLHYGYAVLMLLGLWFLRNEFSGAARTWWNLALIIQVWHHFEHLLLLIQASTDTYYFGGKVPTSVLQQFYPRVELHLFYNTIVTIPMIVAVVLKRRQENNNKTRVVRKPVTS
jgi:hypothetical protein